MSDLYLVLRRRLAQVKNDWVEIDGELLVAARNRKGLSREALGAIVGVVAKTVERYELQGRIPRSLIGRFADALDLEIEEVPPLGPLRIHAQQPSDDHLEALGGKVDQVTLHVDRGFSALNKKLQLLEQRLFAEEPPAAQADEDAP
jgi:transcriptional regulator with XRE-family HTH domain